MAAYFLAAVDINDVKGFQKYSEAGFASMEGVKFEVISIDDNPLLLEGKLPGHHIVILKFDSKEDIKKWYDSAAYAKAKPFRHASCDTAFFVALDQFKG